jgi:hypothetical protein
MMTATDIFVQRLETATTLPTLLAAGWESFDFIARTTPSYDDPDDGPRGFAFMLATVAASRGRNALGYAPSLPDDDASTEPEIEALGDEAQAAACLAGLAAVIQRRLTDACSMALGDDDRRACEAAVAAAAETRTMLAGDDQS